MALKIVTVEEVLKRGQEDVESDHLGWLDRRIYAKTPLTTFNYCPHKFELRYVKGEDEFWGDDLIEGIAGHKMLQVYHLKAMRGEHLFPVEARDLFLVEIERLRHRAEGTLTHTEDWVARALKLLTLYHLSWKDWYQEVTAVEEVWGPFEFGGKQVAGHGDLRSTRELYVDFKFVGSRSGYRRPKKLDLGMELNKNGLKVKKSAFLPLVKDLKSGPKIDGLIEVAHSKDTKKVVEHQVHDLCEAIERGDLSKGAPEIGTGLCQAKYCLVPETRVLTYDLNWVPIGDVDEGDALWGFDESTLDGGSRASTRRWRRSIVNEVEPITQACIELRLSSGVALTSSRDHFWLADLKGVQGSGRYKWRKAEDLKIGQRLRMFCPVWDRDVSRESGWLSGITDGEGHLKIQSKDKRRAQNYRGISEVGVISQVAGLVLDQAKEYLEELGFGYSERWAQQPGSKKFCKVVLGRFPHHIRYMGQVRPVRFFGRYIEGLEGRPNDAVSCAEIVGIRDVGNRSVMAVSTTTKTFFAEGFGSHNCSFFGRSCRYTKHLNRKTWGK